MNKMRYVVAVASLVFVGAVAAGNSNHGHNKHDYGPRQDLYEYAKVIESRPIYREVEVSRPIRECWEEPVYHTRSHKSAGGMLAGGLIGGIVGHQFGRGRANKVATAVGALIGAKIGHDAVNGQVGHDPDTVAGYEEHCKTRHQVSYEHVVDGYDVTYRYRGKQYHLEMPYDPGKRIKMRIQFTPVI